MSWFTNSPSRLRCFCWFLRERNFRKALVLVVPESGATTGRFAILKAPNIELQWTCTEPSMTCTRRAIIWHRFTLRRVPAWRWQAKFKDALKLFGQRRYEAEKARPYSACDFPLNGAEAPLSFCLGCRHRFLHALFHFSG